jgi:hypothetical protein
MLKEGDRVATYAWVLEQVARDQYHVGSALLREGEHPLERLTQLTSALLAPGSHPGKRMVKVNVGRVYEFERTHARTLMLFRQ